MATVAAQPRIDRDEYRRRFERGELPDNVYLLNGELITKLPQNSPHAFAVSFLTEALTLVYQGARGVRTQCPLALSDDSEPEPDLAVTRESNAAFRTRHPEPADILLLIEVADSSAMADRRNKLPRYFAAGIPEVWLVDLTAQIVRRFTPDGNHLYYKEDQFAPGEVIGLPDADSELLIPKELFNP